MNIDNLEITKKVSSSEAIVTYSGPIDYEENVINKPLLNGKTIVGNMTEDDPTMQPMDLIELNNIFNSIFE